MPVHVVRQGECFTRIAQRYGFADYRVVYNHPDNADLKKRRPNPNVLWPGDRIVIPDREEKEVACAAGKKHTFQVKIPRKELRLKLINIAGEPFANEPYEIDVQGEVKEGTTDGDGFVKEKVSADAETATLSLGDYVVELRFGHLNPLKAEDKNDATGVQARLKNLGYDVGPSDGQFGRRTKASLALFQSDHGLSVDGELNDDTRKKLEREYGS